MDEKTFLTRQLATTGWAPIHPAVAKLIDPEAGNVNTQRDLAIDQQQPGNLLRVFPRTALCMAKIEGFGRVPILYRSPLVLAERIAFLTGGEVELIEDATLPKVAEPVRLVEIIKPSRIDERLERLKAVAAQDLPSHECSLRTDILKARTETGWKEPVAEPERTEGAEEVSAVDRASAMIVSKLKAGPCHAAEVLAAAEGAGLSERTVQLAAERLGVVKRKAGFSGGWTWAMPISAAA